MSTGSSGSTVDMDKCNCQACKDLSFLTDDVRCTFVSKLSITKLVSLLKIFASKASKTLFLLFFHFFDILTLNAKVQTKFEQKRRCKTLMLRTICVGGDLELGDSLSHHNPCVVKPVMLRSYVQLLDCASLLITHSPGAYSSAYVKKSKPWLSSSLQDDKEFIPNRFSDPTQTYRGKPAQKCANTTTVTSTDLNIFVTILS